MVENLPPIFAQTYLIGDGHPCFIIAEAGVNHNGRLDIALELVDAAAESGADAVKFQTWITQELVASSAETAEYQKRNTGREESQFEMLKRLELAWEEFRQIKAHAEKRGILFLSTPDEERSAEFLAQLDIGLFKIGSAELTNIPFLEHVAGFGKPMILSTGMGWLSEVEAAVNAIRDAGCKDLVLLQCVSEYPAEPGTCNLRAMDTMRRAFQVPVGFSDHTMGLHTAAAAAAMGACVIEKHMTLDQQLEGPDHCASLDPGQFRELVRAVRETEASLGSGIKQPTDAEVETRRLVRKVAVAASDLSAGHSIRSTDVRWKRSKGTIAPCQIEMVVGRKLNRALAADESISLSDLA